MNIVITDTNIFFDLIGISALKNFFSLAFQIYTTDFVINEILKNEQKEEIFEFINNGKLTVFKFSENDIENVKSFITKRNFKGLTDKTVLWKAKQLSCMLLSGDGKMRKEAEDQGIRINGIIWVIDELINQVIISPIKAIEFYKKLKEINSSLPITEIDKRITYYQKILDCEI